MDDKIGNSAGDVIALLRLTLAGDAVTSVEIVDKMDKAEMMRVLAMSLGLTCTALNMVSILSNISLDKILLRLVLTNEKMRNGDI